MMEALRTVGFLGLIYLFLFLIERIRPLRSSRNPLLSRIVVNAAISLAAFATAAVLIRPTVQYLLQWTEQNGFGLLQWLELHDAMKFVLAFLLLDLSFYYWHRLNHEIPFLWRFHNVHHIDPDLDVTTGFRFHPGEIALSTGFRIVQISLLGVSGWTFLIYEAVFQLGTLFHHSNIRIPIKFEKPLNWAIVTPRMHGIHHSTIKDETNSNYSVVFSFWDRIHKSFNSMAESVKNDVGVPGYSEANDNSIYQLLTAPFKKQRPYWPK